MTVRQAESIDRYIASVSAWSCSDAGLSDLVRLVEMFSYTAVYDATRIAFAKYYRGTEKSWQYAFKKIGGVCYNKWKQKREAEDGDL